MKRIFASLLLISFFSLRGISQNIVSDATAESRTVSGFHGIEVSTGITLMLSEGNEAVAVSAANVNYRDKIVTVVEKGILKIYYDNKTGAINKNKENKDLKAYVSYRSLDLLHANTGAFVKITGILKSPLLDMDANTGAGIEGAVDIVKLKVSQNTGSRITLSGKAESLEIDGDTGSKFKGEELSTSNCNATVSTGANISVTAEKQLSVKASTGGNVRYKGVPGIKEIKTSTGGSVNKI